MADERIPDGATTGDHTQPTTTTESSEEKACDRVLGRKFFIVMAAFAAFAIIIIFKQDVTGAQALEYLLWLVGIGIGGIALEDGVGKIFKR
jgi:hypothetical protein